MYNLKLSGSKVAIYTRDGHFRGAFTWQELFEIGFIQDLVSVMEGVE